MPIKLPDRKYSLMIRDPLVQNFDEKFKNWLENRNNETLSEEVDQLKDQVKKKWVVGIYIPETTIQGVSDFWLPTSSIYEAVKDEREAARRKEHLIIDKDLKMTFLKVRGLVWCSPHEIPIIIDPTILTLNDAQKVKKAVWDIVKSEIGKQKSIIKGRVLAVPPKEPKELAAVFRCHQETFEKYLRWYDRKMAGLSFRLIALIEFSTKNADDREQKIERYIAMKKKPRIGLPVKGESRVREGFGLIYQAIFRTSSPSKEDLIQTSEKYNCLHHGQDCPEDCDYLKRWYTDFENKHKVKSLKEQLSPF